MSAAAASAFHDWAKFCTDVTLTERAYCQNRTVPIHYRSDQFDTLALQNTSLHKPAILENKNKR